MILSIALNPAIDTTIFVDNLALGAVNRAKNSTSAPAGKGLNVAVVLTQLGASVMMAGFLGVQNRAPFDEQLAQLGIDNGLVAVDGATRQNVKIVSDAETTDINTPSFVVDDVAKAAFFAALPAQLAKCRAAVVAGSLPMGFSLADFAQLLTVLQQSGKPFAVDTSGAALQTALAFAPAMIKPNLDEWGTLVSADFLPEESEKLATSVQKNAPKVTNVVLSLGADGLLWFANNKSTMPEIWRANAPKVVTKSTVGAGDSLLAALFWHWLNGADKKTAMAQGSAVAASAVTCVGVGVPDKETLAALAAEVTVIQLA